MKKLGLSVLLLLFSCVAWGEDWNKTFQVANTPTLHVETDDAHIEVRNCSCKQIEARVLIEGYKPGTVKITDSQQGDRVSLNVRVHPHNMNFNITFGGDHRSVHVEVRVPQQSN